MDLKSTLKTIKLNETLISAVLGVIVIIVIGIIAVNFFSKNQEGETIPSLDVEETTALPSTHVVTSGEDLWTISEKYYGTGYNWPDIAEANNLINPNEISEGDALTIPDVTPRLTEGESLPTQAPDITIEPTSVPVAETPGDKTIHKIAEGENLWKIAEKYYQSGYNWTDIASTNNITNPNLIETDQELTIPDVTPKTATLTAQDSDASEQPAESISGATYTVEKDDNLWNIAVRAYGDGYRWEDIAKENDLSNPGLIHPGNSLRLPR